MPEFKLIMEYKKKQIKPDPVKEFKGVKILLAGEGGVGKSSIVLRLSTGVFDSKYNPTIGSDFVNSSVTVKGEEVKVKTNKI